jgi:MFS family permease
VTAGSRTLRAFRHRNYRLFFGGQLVSLIGTWMQTIAQAWLILKLTGDPFMLGLVSAIQWLPVLILGLFGGIVADVLPKRRTLLATQVTMMALAALLGGLVLAEVIQVWMILVIALLLGTANAVDMPVRQAFAVEMVGREDVFNAVALNSAMFNIARIVGPAVGGLFIAAFGVAYAFLINAASFLAVIVGLLAMRDDELVSPPLVPRPRTVREVGTNLAEGLRYVRATPLVLMATLVVGVVSTFAMNFNVLVPPYARDVLGQDADGLGFLLAAMGIGSLTAALLLARAGRPSPWAIVGGALLLGVAEAATGFARTYPLGLGLLFLVGLGAIAMTATANTTIQLAVPDALRGRVLAIYTTVFAGSTPIGGLFAGVIASALGVPAALVVGGVIAAATGLLGLAWLRRLSSRAQVEPDAIRVA